jgi:hypothetical protein
VPLLVADSAQLEQRREPIVAFLIDVGADGDLLADDALDGVAAVTDLRVDGFDDHTGIV